MIRIGVICLICLLCSQSISFAQNKSFVLGTNNSNEGAITIVMGPLGDYFIAGYSGTSGIITRVQDNGNIIWSQSIDFGIDPDYILELDLTSDNFIIGTGNSRTGGGTNTYGFAFKIDLNGNVVWQKKIIFDNRPMWARSIQEVGNGNYNICGDYLNNHGELFLLQLNAMSGNIIWDSIYTQSNFGNSYDESFNDQAYFQPTKSTYVVGRMQKAAGQGTYRPSLSMLDSNNVMQWTKTFLYNSAPTGGQLYSFSVDIDGDSLIISILGNNGGTGAPLEVGIIKTDTAGNVGWSKLYSGIGGEDLRSYSTINCPNGYIISGNTESGNKSLFMIKTDKSGNVLWSKKYGGSGIEDVYLTNYNSGVIIDNSYAVTVGRTNSYNSNYDMFLVKADLTTGNLSNTSCYSDLMITTTNLSNFQEDYALLSGSLPITLSTPPAGTIAVQLHNGGNLVETISDTIVSNDTIYLCHGENVAVKADSFNSLNYLWNTGNINQIDTLSISGTYWVDVSGSNGCIIWSDTVHVLVDSISLDLGNDTTICGNSPITLNAFNTNASYFWQDGSNNSAFTLDTSGLFSVTVSSLKNCQATDSIQITFIDQPDVNLGNDTIICFSDSLLILDAQNVGFTYLWNIASSNQQILVDTSGIYWVIVSNGVCNDTDSVNVSFVIDIFELGPDTTICNSDSLVLNVDNSNNNILWSNGSITSSITIDSTNVYWVEVSNNGCFYSDTIDITVLPAPVVNLGNDTSLCSPPIMLFGQNLGASYNWSTGSTTQNISINQNGIYWLNASYGSCIATDSIEITFSQPVIDLGDDKIICENDQLLLDAGNIGSVYNWNNGSNGQTINVSQEGTYFVTVSDPNGCSATDTIVVSIQEITANYSIEFNSDCAPVMVVFNDLSSVVNFGSITNWNWQFGDNSSSTDQSTTHLYNETGTFLTNLTVTSNIGCTSTFSSPTTIDVMPSANADFKASPTSVAANQTVNFINLSSNYSNWTWDFGDQQGSSDKNPSHVYPNKGAYKIQLIVSNEFNCPDTSELVLIVVDELLIYAPNIFTPDQNNYNENWKIHITGVDQYKFKVTLFNRWGEIIWISNDSDKSWNGYYNGNLVQDGVYVWKLECETLGSSERHTFHGTVTVLR
ncbi:MAG: PKD domain-containing protein [Crocinitomicaceae bacterium]